MGSMSLQATIWTNTGLMHDRDLQNKRDTFHYGELNIRYGVLSLTAEPANINM